MGDRSEPEEVSRRESISELISSLEASDQLDLSSELSTLAAIFGTEAIAADFTIEDQTEKSRPTCISLYVQLELGTGTEAVEDAPLFKIQINIPNDYPAQLSDLKFVLLSSYLGPFRVDSELIETVKDISKNLNTEGCAIYDGIERIKDILNTYYLKQIKLKSPCSRGSNEAENEVAPSSSGNKIETAQAGLKGSTLELDKNQVFEVFNSSPIVDRKSIFVGHSVKLTDPKEVPKIMAQLLSDKRISKASHNMIAWRCEYNGCMHQDNDDDGETAAGSRIQHLLNVLQVRNVFVCVSRWFGGIHLGGDRFKHINQAAREALLEGKFICNNTLPNNSNSSDPSKSQSKSKSIGKSRK